MQMDIKKILVTGANGQLGNELRLMSENFPQFEYLFTVHLRLPPLLPRTPRKAA